MTKIKCEVCETEISGSQCLNCGWILVHLPQSAPQKIREMYSLQTSKMKAAYELNQIVESLINKELQLKSQIEELKVSAKQFAQDKIVLSESESRLKLELSSLKEKIRALEKQSIVKGYLIHQKGTLFSVYPVYDGCTNYYATAKTKDDLLNDKENVQTLSIISSVNIALSIRVDNKGSYRISDIGGTAIIAGKTIKPDSRLMNLTYIYIKDTNTTHILYFTTTKD